ncbi:MAG: transcriptional regulator BetI [Sulfitobacter sp.]
MAKATIKSVRQSELSKAAFAVLVEKGIRNTTVEQVAARAGVSKSVVLHHYGDKNALFQAVMRRVNTVLRDGVVELLKNANTPMERLAAIIVGNFSYPIFEQKVCHAWLNLCGDVPYNTDSQRIQTVIASRMRSNLVPELRKLPLKFELESVASQIRISIDGIWLQASLQTEPLSSREGIDATLEATIRLAGFDDKVAQELFAAARTMETVAGIVLKSKAFNEKLS